MENTLYIQLAPIRLRPGIDEAALIEASEAFDRDFVRKQSGVIRRHLVRGKAGGYADLVFFESREAAEKVWEAEASSPECAAFFAIMEAPDPNLPDMGVLSFQLIKTYE